MKAVRCNSAYALSEDEVCESNKYNFKATVIQNIIYVYSILDLWLIQKVGVKKFYLYIIRIKNSVTRIITFNRNLIILMILLSTFTSMTSLF